MKVGDLVMFIYPRFPEEQKFHRRVGLITKKIGEHVRVDWVKTEHSEVGVGKYSHFRSARFEVINSAKG